MFFYVYNNYYIHVICIFIPLVFQIAAKIGGDAGPPLTNSTESDGFPFTAQKRQLEDAGMVTLICWGSD